MLFLTNLSMTRWKLWLCSLGVGRSNDFLFIGSVYTRICGRTIWIANSGFSKPRNWQWQLENGSVWGWRDFFCPEGPHVESSIRQNFGLEGPWLWGLAIEGKILTPILFLYRYYEALDLLLAAMTNVWFAVVGPTTGRLVFISTTFFEAPRTPQCSLQHSP